MANEANTLVVSVVAGIALGLLFFGGLWWTVRYGMRARHAAIWILLSSQLRTVTVVAGFYVVGRHDWHQLVLSVVAFFMTRSCISFWLRRSSAAPDAAIKQLPEHVPKDWSV